MTSKKFFWGIVLVAYSVVILFALLIRCIDPMDYMDNEFASWQQQKDYIRAQGAERQIIFLGDSVFKAAVLPELISEKAQVLALGGATPIEMYYTLNEYLSHHPVPEKVFISFSPLHYADMESYRSRNLYFHYFPWREVVASQMTIFRYDKQPWFKYVPDLADDTEYLLRLPTKYFRTIYDSRLQRSNANHKEYEAVSAARGHKYFGLSSDWYLDYKPYQGWLKPFVPLNSLDFYIKEIIDVCKNNNIEVHVVQEPIHTLDYELISSRGYLEAFQTYMHTLATESGIDVECELPVYGVEYFGDNLHVNEAGAKRYSIELRDKYLKK